MATIPLGPSLPAGSSNQPGVIARATRPLSGLASGGVCRAPSVTREAVRSYRTVSPLPTSRWAVCFLWHCPASHLDWPLASTLPCEARTFLSRRHLRTVASGRLDLSVERAPHTYSRAGPAVKQIALLGCAHVEDLGPHLVAQRPQGRARRAGSRHRVRAHRRRRCVRHCPNAGLPGQEPQRPR